ncbi:hypothetical protein [uncultured Sulfitobacter sp.]|uniref:hypothetical protein n=1 Tax=uncultured Sulfitobacter sp. TaxID=191468 RepID=UPI002622388D|nr:hypothetical protein [uncultured Sulfitobacter sp.]
MPIHRASYGCDADASDPQDNGLSLREATPLANETAGSGLNAVSGGPFGIYGPEHLGLIDGAEQDSINLMPRSGALNLPS